MFQNYFRVSEKNYLSNEMVFDVFLFFFVLSCQIPPKVEQNM